MDRQKPSILGWPKDKLKVQGLQTYKGKGLSKQLDLGIQLYPTKHTLGIAQLRTIFVRCFLSCFLSVLWLNLSLLSLEAQTPNLGQNTIPNQAPLAGTSNPDPKNLCTQQKLPKSCPVYQKELANCNSSLNTWGCIDWENFKAYGLGELKPEELYQNALQNRNNGAVKARAGLKEALLSLAIDSKMTLEESVDFRPIFNQHFQTLVHQSFLVDQRETANKRLYSLVELSFLPFFAVYWNYRNFPVVDLAPPDASAAASPTFSGLLLNATDVSLRPALFPVILSEQGERLFTLTAVSKSQIESQGFFRYFTNITSARASGVLGPNPLVLKVARASGKYPVDLVLAEKEARIFLNLLQTQRFLEEGKIAVLYKPE